ncbi:MAG: putative Class E Vps protein of the ESCRT-III complex [Streblomastix strix]|uniref:Putative Class E Vps protein of the ESCRT-III complex n=1 Tax=Streblomastix strix TaxID=222440 RepID=A0A5J4WNS3_9EUKA|nr:MAG: putative Class E Vps protein of the ESCRT-III complex [Streblomastix strix]
MPRQIFDIIFDLKIAVRSYERQSAYMRKKAEEEKLKVKRAIQQNNPQGAQVYAENAIRNQNMSQFFLRTASRLEGIINKLEINQGMQDILKVLDQANSALSQAFKDSDMKKVNNVIQQFEKLVGGIDVLQTNLIPDQISNPEVDNLVSQMAAELNIQQPTIIQPIQQPLPIAQNLAPQPIYNQPQMLLAYNDDTPQPQPQIEPQQQSKQDLVPAQIISVSQPYQEPQSYLPDHYTPPLPQQQLPPIPDIHQRDYNKAPEPTLPVNVPFSAYPQFPAYPQIPVENPQTGLPVINQQQDVPQYQQPEENDQPIFAPQSEQSPEAVPQQLTIQQQIRNNRRTIERTISEIDRAIQEMQANEKNQIKEIKKALKAQQPSSAKILAKNIVRIRANIDRMYLMRANMVGLQLRIVTIGSSQKMMECLKGVGCVLRIMNKDMKDANSNDVIGQFLKDNEELNIQMEDFDILIGSIFPQENPDDSDEIVDRIIAEIQMEQQGLQQPGVQPIVPLKASPTPQQQDPTQPGGQDDDLERRLNQLRRT